MPALYPKKFKSLGLGKFETCARKLGVSFFARLRGLNCKLPVRGRDLVGTFGFSRRKFSLPFFGSRRWPSSPNGVFLVKKANPAESGMFSPAF